MCERETGGGERGRGYYHFLKPYTVSQNVKGYGGRMEDTWRMYGPGIGISGGDMPSYHDI